MKILVTNDDGVGAPGLLALAEALKPLGSVTIVAPETEMSAMSHALTLTRPLRVRTLAPGVYSVDGTPTDCVYLAIYQILGRDVDLVASGVNAGFNLGDDITYSGTVAAALEGTLLGCPSFAISLERSASMDYERAGVFARTLAERVIEHGLPRDVYLNVNVPAATIQGVAFARQGKRIYHDGVSAEPVEGGETLYRIGGYPEWDEQPGADITAFRSGKITITPLRVDVTDDDSIEALSRWRLDTPGAAQPTAKQAGPARRRGR